jgi:hypothetical protein
MARLSAPPDRPLLSAGTVRDRCYGHAEGTDGADKRREGGRQTVRPLIAP